MAGSVVVVVVDLVLRRFTEVVPTMLGGTFVSGGPLVGWSCGVVGWPQLLLAGRRGGGRGGGVAIVVDWLV